MKTVVNLNEEQLDFIEQLLRDTRESFSTTLNELRESDSKKDRRKFAAYWATLAELTVKCRIANREQKTVDYSKVDWQYIFPVIKISNVCDCDSDMIKYYEGLGLKLLSSMRYGNPGVDDRYIMEHLHDDNFKMAFIYYFVIPEHVGFSTVDVPLYKEKEGVQ